MTKKVFALGTKPGIQRDGTTFDKNFYTAGKWVRFQRGRPRKIGGYRQLTDQFSGPSRGLYVIPRSGYTSVYSGHFNGLQTLDLFSNGSVGAVTDLTLSDFTADANNLWQFDTFTDSSGSGNNLLLAHPAPDMGQIDDETNAPVLGGTIGGTTLSQIGVFTETGTTVSGSPTVTLASANLNIGAGQTVTGTGIAAGTTVVSVVTTTLTLSQNATANGTVTLTFNNNISVSGGVVSLHPYVFVYGNDGLIKNSSAGNVEDWVSADANEVNVSTGKIVQGLTVRGGSNAPSGLFWSLDSLIRVSFVGGVGTPAQYWRYDIISSQSSILSSQSVIEYDGIYYWCGVDRFLLYNGVVKEVPNNFNQNHFFDNLNYAQRQKVYATKVPRFGEIWWFYPRGDATECTDAIIYNVRENVWYDAGEALGARRSAGYFSQVFQYPLNAGTEASVTGCVAAGTITNGGTGYANGAYPYTVFSGGSGSGFMATVTVSGGVVTSVVVDSPGSGYLAGDELTISGIGSGFLYTITEVDVRYALWQHEFGTDAVSGINALAIESNFETNDIGWVGGGPPSQDGAFVNENRWLRLERVEPDFIQTGQMELFITGRPYAQSDDVVSTAYTFDPGTNKIDMKEQRRELRMKFVSNVAGGDYQLGKVLLSADIGDVRGY
jgi:hypothetical protein